MNLKNLRDKINWCAKTVEPLFGETEKDSAAITKVSVALWDLLRTLDSEIEKTRHKQATNSRIAEIADRVLDRGRWVEKAAPFTDKEWFYELSRQLRDAI